MSRQIIWGSEVHCLNPLLHSLAHWLLLAPSQVHTGEGGLEGWWGSSTETQLWGDTSRSSKLEAGNCKTHMQFGFQRVLKPAPALPLLPRGTELGLAAVWARARHQGCHAGHQIPNWDNDSYTGVFKNRATPSGVRRETRDVPWIARNKSIVPSPLQVHGLQLHLSHQKLGSFTSQLR